jgi:hypothetical protein
MLAVSVPRPFVRTNGTSSLPERNSLMLRPNRSSVMTIVVPAITATAVVVSMASLLMVHAPSWKAAALL